MTGLMSFAEFRRIRDESALASYAQRKPVLQDRERRLRAYIDHWRRERKATGDNQSTEREQIDDHLKDAGRKLQTATAELASIERDEPIRKQQLAQTYQQLEETQ